MMDTLTVAIPTWNNKVQLQGCLDTMMTYTKPPEQVFVVDNGCDDVLQADAKSWPESIKYLRPSENLGWMGGINFALAQCKTDLFCLMNDDVMFVPNQREFWNTLSQHFVDDGVGIVAPSSNFIAGTQGLLAFTEMVYDVTLVMGVCIMMPTWLLDSLGGLDSTMVGGDDIDLCIRVSKVGKTIRVDKNAFLHHIGQQSGRRKQGDYYDSAQHQEATVNGIISKHGLKEYIRASSFIVDTSKVMA